MGEYIFVYSEDEELVRILITFHALDIEICHGAIHHG